jgi:hypothetical protein
VTIESVHVTGNTAFGNAGGGVSFLNGTHRIVNSTFSANTAFNCGGISNSSSLLTIINSTISGNSVSQLGGGLCANGNTTLRNVTITNNTAALGGGILKAATGTLNLSNTIVAGNGATEILFNAGAIISAGNNLIGDSPGEAANTGQFMSVVYHPSDILNTPPMLGTLQNNGGTTPTHAPLFNSPVIDAGSNALTFEPFDQRGAGFPRIVDGDGNGSAIVDIGAFELQPPVVLPDQLIGNLIGTIGNFIDNPNPRLRAGIERNLIARLENALADLAAGDTQGARNEIEAFINLVRSLSGKLISQQRADELIAEANKILEAINSQQ